MDQQPIVMACGCGRQYDPQVWKSLPFIGLQEDGEGGELELRACEQCQSTIAAPVETRRATTTARAVLRQRFENIGTANASTFAGLFLHQANGDVEHALELCPTEPKQVWSAARAMLRLVATEEYRTLSLVAGGRQ